VFKKKRSPKRAAVTGLELDPGHLAAAEVTQTMALARGAVAPLDPGLVRDGEVADVEGVAEALKTLFAEHELPRRVRVGIANQRIVVRTLDLPPLTDPKALAAAVKVEAPDHIPMPMDEAVLDWRPLGPAGDRARVVVVAVRREAVAKIVAAAHAADLELEGIDLAAFGMVRALGANSSGAALYVSVSGITNVAVADERGCLFTRAAAGGLEAMATTLCERRALTRDHARQWLRHVGLTAPLEDVDGDPGLVSATRTVLEEGVDRLTDDVRGSLDFYRAQADAAPVEHGVVCGAAAEVPGFVEELGDRLQLPLKPGLVTGEHESLPRLAVAAGLAVDATPGS
jgi:type IV pilus assembly protein PilM